MDELKIGSIVHYVLESGRGVGTCRPAVVVRNWSHLSKGAINLQVFTDGYNDEFRESVAEMQASGEAVGITFSANTLWRTSILYSENKEPGTWHWMGEGDERNEGERAF